MLANIDDDILTTTFGPLEDLMPNDVTKELVEERGSVYGHPLDDFRRNASIEEAVAECKDAEIRHAIRMIWVKCCRLIETPDHFDSIWDIKGYAETMHMVHTERKAREIENGKR